MSDTTKIEWTDATWSPIAAFRRDNGKRGWHCEKVSAACRGCYAERLNGRKLQSGTGLPYTRASRDLVEIRAVNLDVPLRWRRPRRIFVESMSDLFAEFVPDELIDQVFAAMALCPQHTFQVLTKRPERMRAWAQSRARGHRFQDIIDFAEAEDWYPDVHAPLVTFPLPNVWLGVSVEDQATADERIPLLLSTPAAVRFVSYEPALGPVDFKPREWLGEERRGDCGGCVPAGATGRPTCEGHDVGGLDWIIVGGESGPGARPFDVAWARQTIAQCREVGVACFVKQLGARPVEQSLREFHSFKEWVNKAQTRVGEGDACFDARGRRCAIGKDFQRARDDDAFPITVHGRVPLRDRKGGDWNEWPEDLRVREFPAVRA